ncbi:hypothetical protein C8D76_1282 [Pasteurella langaaensis DSM 22999]|uniref:Uncharacterized protein n=1 Tax=Alitibacter langaaensis DSM 22999 TaxID=1122935 RepID=A0A2U0SJX3_9PAST|nr:hypothetical protein C8D76_1282 [Pasteurella langaaensis DSM 22999]
MGDEIRLVFISFIYFKTQLEIEIPEIEIIEILGKMTALF